MRILLVFWHQCEISGARLHLMEARQPPVSRELQRYWRMHCCYAKKCCAAKSHLSRVRARSPTALNGRKYSEGVQSLEQVSLSPLRDINCLLKRQMFWIISSTCSMLYLFTFKYLTQVEYRPLYHAVSVVGLNIDHFIAIKCQKKLYTQFIHHTAFNLPIRDACYI